jgi:hypothetical protein
MRSILPLKEVGELLPTFLEKPFDGSLRALGPFRNLGYLIAFETESYHFLLHRKQTSQGLLNDHLHKGGIRFQGIGLRLERRIKGMSSRRPAHVALGTAVKISLAPDLVQGKHHSVRVLRP